MDVPEARSRPRDRVRQVVNCINLSTLVGLLVATIGRATFSRGPRHTILATDLKLPLRAGALTIGDVVMTRKTRERMLERVGLLRHELRHTVQYAWCLGVVMLVLYALAAGWSWILTGDPASRNVFERFASLEDGNYQERPCVPASPVGAAAVAGGDARTAPAYAVVLRTVVVPCGELRITRDGLNW